MIWLNDTLIYAAISLAGSIVGWIWLSSSSKKMTIKVSCGYIATGVLFGTLGTDMVSEKLGSNPLITCALIGMFGGMFVQQIFKARHNIAVIFKEVLLTWLTGGKK